VCLNEESASGGGNYDANYNESEDNFAKFTEDSPDENNSNESDDPDNNSIDSEVFADVFYGVIGAVYDLLARFGNLINVDIGGIIDNVFHRILTY